MSSLSSIQILKTIYEAFDHFGWRQVMINEIQELASLPSRKKNVGCRKVCASKVGPNVANGYTQTYGLDYDDSFSPIPNIDFVHLFLAMAASSLIIH
ncbi:hypothetical protein CR513_32532, partial [Mucuna pruriens]